MLLSVNDILYFRLLMLFYSSIMVENCSISVFVYIPTIWNSIYISPIAQLYNLDFGE